jgi:hypothetical protein
MRTYFVLILALLLAAQEVAAQQSGPPRVVTLLDDLTGRPIQGASVTIDPGGLQRISDLAGEVRLSLPAGAFTLSVSALGYSDLHLRIEVPEGATNPLHLRMVPSPVAVEGLDVEGSREPVDVRGMVRDASDDRPLVGATVSFPFANRRWVSLTDPEGSFRVGGVRPGIHWIQATHLGYEGAAISIPVGSAWDRPVEIALRPDTALLRGVAELSARMESDRRAMAGMTVRHVGRERIAASPWWRDAQDVLRDTGVHVVPCADPSAGGTCVPGRGGSTTATTVCIDGAVVNGGLDQLRTYHPRELHLIEIFGRGAIVHAYTVAFMEHYGRRPGRSFRCPDPNVG